MGRKSRQVYAGNPGDNGTELAILRASTIKSVDVSKPSVKNRASTVYKKYIIEGLLRQKPLRPSKDGRHVPLQIEHERPLVDERRGYGYVPNTIRTSRYTIWDFLPKQLIFQFTRLANFYFLVVGIPQTIPGLSTTGNYTTILPLLFFVLLTVVKEGYDDYKRHRLDKLENANTVSVLGKPLDQKRRAPVSRKLFSSRSTNPLKTSSDVVVDDQDFDDTDPEYAWRKIQWREVKVGDIIRLARDEEVPADMVLLYASNEAGLAYIDTMALDGETNLKVKQACPAIDDCSSINAIRECHAHFVLEDPNPDLYSFNGKVTVGSKTLPLTLNEVVYRGSTLRNTRYAIAMVVNTGEECKIRLNANQHPKAKKPALEHVSNRIVLTLAFYVIVLTAGCSVGYVLWRNSTERISWYINMASVEMKEIIIGFAIQFNNVIPLALYVSLEIVKIGQMLMLNGDLEMYDEATDTPARCNTNTILENLGQVSYVFSDKTGTLTENVMKFRKLSIAGTSWLHEMDMEPPSVDSATPADSPSSAGRPQFPLRKSKEITRLIHENVKKTASSPVSITVTSPELSRPSTQLSRRSSSQWRSAARPDHIQPELTTRDLLEYIQSRPASLFARKARDYILCLALCHTCLPEVTDGKIDYQSSSPDELALVRAAQEMGYLLVNRSTQTLTLIVKNGERERREVYEILDVIEFSSMRKRMSIVVKYPDGRICLICKGADSTILPRLKLANLALKKVSEVRKSVELEQELLRRSEQLEPRNSFGGRPSLTLSRKGVSPSPKPGSSRRKPAIERSRSFENAQTAPSEDRPRPSLGVRGRSFDVAKALTALTAGSPVLDSKFDFLDDPAINDDSTIFTRCFKHLDEFASEGLRTLLYARKFIPDSEYAAWRQVYNEATTSLVNRQEMIEEAGEAIEQSLDLVGASAIEDKLQHGVPETVDKLRRANIKIWMLTGDKRETAINIAHSARICRPSSDVFVLDSTKDGLDSQIAGVAEDIQSGCLHSVVVIDGHTLGMIEEDGSLTARFYSLITQVDSVICCRASPAQKCSIVQAIRHRVPKALTLAIGDGGNDLAMISASHVGVGISGKEGLQAARVADYSIAQFRFLQRLLLVHGRWNYVRTAKFILHTFWKEMFFYLPTALYQRYNGYTGTSLYESWSLTVFNVLFTSLAVIMPGIWEQDLSATTLLAVPELYVYGQRNMGLNFYKYIFWMIAAVSEGITAWFLVWAGYGAVLGMVDDNGLFALGNLSFTVGVVWINYKLLILETHHKNQIILISFFITFAGWWAWNAFLSGIYALQPSPYAVRDGFIHTFGPDALWWLTLIIVVAMFILVEIVYKTIKHNLVVAKLWRWPPWKGKAHGDSAEEWALDLWQEMEQDPRIRAELRRILEEEERVCNGDPEKEEEKQEETNDEAGLGIDLDKRDRASVVH